MVENEHEHEYDRLRVGAVERIDVLPGQKNRQTIENENDNEHEYDLGCQANHADTPIHRYTDTFLPRPQLCNFMHSGA